MQVQADRLLAAEKAARLVREMADQLAQEG